MNIRLGKRDENVHLAHQWIIEAQKRHSSMILFPELWSSGYDLKNARRHALDNQGLLKQLIDLAINTSMLIGGSLLEQDEVGYLYNVSHLILPSNNLQVIKYKKIHLFGQMGEKRYLHAGNQLQTAQLAWGTVGMAICYDLRFPELFRRYTELGSKAIFIPAEWPLKRTDHWKVLLRARAIENQVFVIGVNAVGISGKETFAGCSAIISPNGETIIEGNASEEELLTTEIDLSAFEEARKSLPLCQDRRPDIYG